MRKRILGVWALYRHGVALKGLAQSLGIWGYIATAAAAVVGTLVSQWVSMPVWGQLLVGLGSFALVLLCVGLAVAAKRAGPDSGTAPPLSSGYRYQRIDLGFKGMSLRHRREHDGYVFHRVTVFFGGTGTAENVEVLLVEVSTGDRGDLSDLSGDFPLAFGACEK